MSDNEEPKPMTKTSAVPIRKETVRVTLKAPPQAGKGASAPSAPPAPMAPPPSVGGPPPAPAPTVPLKTVGAPTGAPPAPAPTVKLQTGPGSAPQMATPAPTVKLSTPAGGPGTVPLATPGAATGPASQQLPKATVQLTQTQPMDSPASTPSQAATIRTADDDDSSAETGEGAVMAFSVVSLVAALIVLGCQLATADIWLEGEWARILD